MNPSGNRRQTPRSSFNNTSGGYQNNRPSNNGTGTGTCMISLMTPVLFTIILL
jgi:hypothetical protein